MTSKRPVGTEAPLNVFVHMHKCAGSTVVRKAIASGFTLAPNHRNGNLVGEDGRQIRYGRMPRASFDELVRDLRRRGIDFFAMEWDFPPISHFEGAGPFRLFTVLREPLDRARANYRFEKSIGTVPVDRSFRDFMNMSYSKPGALYSSANYYVRKLTNSGPTSELTEEHLDEAIAILSRFDAVVLLGVHEIDGELEKLGLHARVEPALVFSRRKAPSHASVEQFAVGEADQAWFVANNALDRKLFEHFREKPPPAIP